MNESEHLSAQILVVDDDAALAETMAEALQRLGHVCTLCHDLASARDELQHGNFDVIVTDLVMDVEDAGMQVLQTSRQTQPNAEVIMVTAHGDIPTAKAALKLGAYDFIEKGGSFDLDVFRNLVNRAAQTVMLRTQNDELRQRVDDKYGLEGIIGTSAAIRQILASVRQVAPSTIPVLITGGSGTGKELIAGAIHRNSDRAKKPFKPLNCAGLSASILESELFGHMKGAFTGAERDRLGVFEYADGGTLFLDEIGDMPMEMQAKLLRVLESGEIVRVGANEPKHVDVRLISATNHDLKEQISSGAFREDLYFRISGMCIHLPPLRDRREDIPLLVRHFVDHFARKMNKPVPRVSDAAMLHLMQHDWPGNVRQLINTVQNMVVVTDSDELGSQQVPAEIRSADAGESVASGSLAGRNLDQVEKQAIRETLRLTAGNREQAAEMLGIGERTLYRKLKEYGLK